MEEALNISLQAFSARSFLVVALVGVAIFIVLYLIYRYLFVFIKSDIWQQRIRNVWPKIQLFTWALYALGAIAFLLNRSLSITLIMLSLVITLGWRFWRDLIAGLAIRMENRIQKGDFINGKDFSGVVDNVGTRGMTLKTDSGEMAFIPFRNLEAYKVRKLERESSGEMVSFSFSLKPEIQADRAVAVVRTSILELPYVLLTTAPHVEVMEISESATKIRMVIRTQNADDAKIAELALKKALMAKKVLI